MNQALAVGTLLLAMSAQAAPVTVEDRDLKAVPDAVAAAVRQALSDPDMRACGLQGRAIGLADRTNLDAYFVTTTSACGWGAAVGPIWVVYPTPPRLGQQQGRGRGYGVAHTTGYSLHVGTTFRHGMPDVSVHAATASWSRTTVWHFDGVAYREASVRPPARKASHVERQVLATAQASAWARLVQKAGRNVAVREEDSAGYPGCRDVTLYEDAGTHLSRFGTWRVCGGQVKRLRDAQ